ncbi:MAG: hypothetical protein O2819_01995 [Planctomycetota bacterium]|nr:hypothetical protein [Planctomycetota bacterium]MDA1105520.1 hypothetical protein [Planctomycetota bacterium]
MRGSFLVGLTVSSCLALALAAQPSAATPGMPQGAQSSQGIQVWTMDFKPGELRVFIDVATGDAYWYLTYVVENHTGRERMWAPTVDLFDGKGKILPSGREIPIEIHDAIKAKFKDGGVQDQFEVLGTIAIGRENGKEGLCIWKAAELDSTDLTVFVRGLSNDFKKERVSQDEEPVTLRRTLRLDYKVGSDERAGGGITARATDSEWVYR